METSKVQWLKDLFDEKKAKGKKFDTLASKYLYQLKSLSKTLTSTSPHYVRCIKPNDIKYRPVDGAGAFNDWKTYRQLLYAGVMEVVKIKKEGFPFREKYDFSGKSVVSRTDITNFSTWTRIWILKRLQRN